MSNGKIKNIDEIVMCLFGQNKSKHFHAWIKKPPALAEGFF